MDAHSTATEEAIRLHDFIAGWFRGEIAPERFEPDFADALHSEFENVQPAGTVLAVVQKGYALNGRLLRPARVLVARAPDPAAG